MPRALDELIAELLADEGRLADITGADDPLARAIAVASEHGLDVSAEEVIAAVERQESLPDSVLALAAGATGVVFAENC